MSEFSRESVDGLIHERDELKAHCHRLQELLANVGWPPGHFYSPVVDVSDPHVRKTAQERLASPPPAGVRIDREEMKALLKRLAVHHSRFPFGAEPGKHRFHYENQFFGCHDASIYFSILMEFRPRRVVEVGSGFSSRLLLDTNDCLLGNSVDVTLVDPSLELAEFGSDDRATLLPMRVQDIDLTLFESLSANDILFIDSSHVSKTGSDVNFCVFEILPRLKPGVIIHVHDIFYPFEYLESWVLDEKRSWNEAYLMRAFLQYNSEFKILYWNNYVYHQLREELEAAMPLCIRNEGGSLWLRRAGSDEAG